MLLEREPPAGDNVFPCLVLFPSIVKLSTPIYSAVPSIFKLVIPIVSAGASSAILKYVIPLPSPLKIV